MTITELIFRQEEQRRIEASEIRSGLPLDILRGIREINRQYLRINYERIESNESQ